MIFGLVGLMSMAPAMVNAADSRIVESREDLSIGSFCRDRLKVLKGAYRLAEIETQAGNFARSAAILEDGLRKAASQIHPRFGQALTSKAIKRGVTLLNELKDTEDSKQKVRTINHFLFNYYGFIENVSQKLDLSYFNTGYSRIERSNTEFERLFVNFAKEQVEMVLKTMTMTEGRTIYPVGAPTMVLKALKVTTQAMADDLSESIFAARFACQIEDLEIVSSDIADYLEFGSKYHDDFTAVQELVGAAKRAVGSRGCRDGYQSQEPRTFDALRGSFNLYSGTTQQVRLNNPTAIKKLIVSAEGIRNDAMFDVVVNGDVKGTIYVPGRDPSYYVTINEFASSIEFVSRNGNATISRVLVIEE